MSQAISSEPLPAKLVLPREQALGQLQAQFKKGSQIKGLRIRNPHDLDNARAKKLAWTNQTTELLMGLFDSSAVADQCNDWVGKIYPEFAELGNFVEQFYAEMEHRLKRLRAVTVNVQKIRTQTHANAPEEPKKTEAPVPLPAALTKTKAALILFGADEASKSSLEKFLGELNFELSVVADLIAEGLERAVSDGAGFGVIVQGEQAGDRAFDMGLCVGRLGVSRVCVMHPGQGNLPANNGGICHLSIDSAGGWQLQLAKHLKRNGAPIDLNRLCS